MAVIRALLIVLEAGCSLVLIGLILLQKSKDGGLGLSFGSGGGDSLFGARAGNVLSKATITTGIIFLVNTLVLGVIFSGGTGRSLVEKELQTAPVPVQQPAVPVQQPAVPAQ